MAHLPLAPHNAKQFGTISNDKLTIIGRVRFARNTWNYSAVRVWNLMNVTFDPAPLPGLVFLFGYRWLAPPANI